MYERCNFVKRKKIFFVCYIWVMNEVNIVGKNLYNLLFLYLYEIINELFYFLKYLC